MRISDWSSDVCSSDLRRRIPARRADGDRAAHADGGRALSRAGGLRSRGGGDRRPSRGGPRRPGALRGRSLFFRLLPVPPIGRAHVCTSFTNSPPVCRPLLYKKNKNTTISLIHANNIHHLLTIHY